ncbi:hypothetical protein O9993_11710 [Vibrio lentus]|nr:hypothetical protein [Vibrio lentus]
MLSAHQRCSLRWIGCLSVFRQALCPQALSNLEEMAEAVKRVTVDFVIT